MTQEKKISAELKEKEKLLRTAPTYEHLVRLWVDSDEDVNYLEQVAKDSLQQFAGELAAANDGEEKEFCDEAISATRLFLEEYIKNTPTPTTDYIKRVCRDLYIERREAALQDLQAQSWSVEELSEMEKSTNESFPDSYETQKPENISWKEYLSARAERDALLVFRAEKRKAEKSGVGDPVIEPRAGRHEHIFTGGKLEADGSVSPENITVDDLLYVTLSVTDGKRGQYLTANPGRDGDGQPLEFIPSCSFIPNINEARFGQKEIAVLARVKRIRNEGDRRQVVVEPAYSFHEIGDLVVPVAYVPVAYKMQYVLPDSRLVPVTSEMENLIDPKTGFVITTGRGKSKSKKQFPFFRLLAGANNANPVEYEFVSEAELKEEDALRSVFYSYLGALGDVYPFVEKGLNYSVGPSVDIATRRMSSEDKAELRAALVEATKHKPLIVAIESRRSDVIRGVRALAENNKLAFSSVLAKKIRGNIAAITIEDLDIISGQIAALPEDVRQRFFPLDLDSELFVVLMRDAGISVTVTPMIPSASVNERLLKVASSTQGRLISGDLTHGSGTRFVSHEYKDYRTGQIREGMLLQVDEGITSRSAAQELFNLLKRLGFYNNHRESALLHTLIAVGASIDSYRGPAYDSREARIKTYKNYDKNFYGNAFYLSRSGQIPQVLQFFRQKVSGRYREIKIANPRMGSQEIENVILTELQTLDITQFFSFDDEYLKKHAQDIAASDEGIRNLEKRGLVLETKYGKILIDPIGAVPLRQMAAFGHGYDGYVNYNPRARLASINIAGFVKDEKGKPILLPPDLLLDGQNQPLGVLTKEGRYWVMNSDQKDKQGGLAGGLQDVIDALADGNDTSQISAAAKELLGEKTTGSTPSSVELFKARRGVNGLEERENHTKESHALLNKVEAGLERMRWSPQYPAAVGEERRKITEQMAALRARYSNSDEWPEDVKRHYDFIEKQIHEDVTAVLDDIENYLRSAPHPRAPFRSAEIFQAAVNSAAKDKKAFILKRFTEMFEKSGVAAYFGQTTKEGKDFVFSPDRFSDLLNVLYERIYRNNRP